MRIPEEQAPDGSEDDPLYRTALAVERDERLAAEMTDWDGTIGDGIGRGGVRLRARRGK